MRWRGLRSWQLVPALVLVVVALAAFTESMPERRLKEELGLVDRGCVPGTAESPGWRAEPPLPAERDEVRAVAVGPAVYMAGGTDQILDYGGPSPVPGVRERVEVRSVAALTRFHPATGRYTELPPMPEALNHNEIATYRGDIYVVGGHGSLLGGAEPKETFLRYSPRTRRWTPMPPMPTARGAAAVGVVGDRLLVAGGLSRGVPLARLEIFDFGERRWSRGPDMPSGREHIAGAVLGGKFYVVGGRDRRTDALPHVERYDPAGRRWERLAPLPVPAGGLEAVVVEGAVLAMGGGNDRAGTVTGAVQRFEAKRGSWEQLPAMRTPRHGLGAAYAGGRLYAFGGSPCPRFAATDIVESFAWPPPQR